MSTFTEFGKLQEVIVGDVLHFNLNKLDKSFALGYGGNIEKNETLRNAFSFDFHNFRDYQVDEQKIYERQEDMDNLSKILTELGIQVIRPKRLESPKTFKTPDFFGVLTPVTNPRDRVFTFGKHIIETPCMVRKRYFENQLLYEQFLPSLESGYNWISAPMPLLQEQRIDTLPWDAPRNFDSYETGTYDIAFDAAQMLKIGKDILLNISTYNHANGAKWIENLFKILEPDVKIHKIYQLDDNHIDGRISVLRPGVFLVNNIFLTRDIRKYLPEVFHNWKIIYTSLDQTYGSLKKWSDVYTYLELCSTRGSFTNVLSLDENRVCVLENATDTIRILEQEGFEVIPIRLRHCELFGGGIHCATLDTKRDDQLISYL